MIDFWCRNCGKTMKSHDKDAGKKCECPGCGKINTIPVTRSVEPVKKPKPVPARIGKTERDCTMIQFWCRNCGETIKIDDKYAGKKCKCPNCEKIITIPMPLTAEPVANSEPVPARIPTPSESPPDATPATPAAPVGSDKEKIKYKCPECGEKLENTGSMGGSEDKCPLCGNIHTVPLSKGQKKTVREQEAQREREEEEVRSRQESYQREDVRREEEQAELLELPSHDTLCFISLLIPLIGLIVGVMLLTRSDAKENGTGNSCLIYAGIGFVIWIVFTVLITLILAVNARGI